MLSKEEVLHIAKLARLELTEQETVKMQKDLAAVLEYFKILQKVKSQKSEVKSLPVEQATRKDVAQKDNSGSELVNLAPDKKDSYIKVKSIF